MENLTWPNVVAVLGVIGLVGAVIKVFIGWSDSRTKLAMELGSLGQRLATLESRVCVVEHGLDSVRQGSSNELKDLREAIHDIRINMTSIAATLGIATTTGAGGRRQ